LFLVIKYKKIARKVGKRKKSGKKKSKSSRSKKNSGALQKIVARAKVIRRAQPNIEWKITIKKASAKYRNS
jgi:hypothetical protein